MKINYKVILINFVILFLISCGGKQKTTDQNQTKKLISQNLRSSLALTPGTYIIESDSSSVLWECRWLGGNKHDGDIKLEKGSVTIKDGNDVSNGNNCTSVPVTKTPISSQNSYVYPKRVRKPPAQHIFTTMTPEQQKHEEQRRRKADKLDKLSL